MMDFVKVNLASDFSTEFELSVASGFAAFDYSSLTVSNFEELFGALSFADTVSDSVLGLLDAPEFATISLAMSVQTVALGAGAELEVG